jgi:hypothetical protein
MQRQLRVDAADVQTMANRWSASVSELNTTAPSAFGLSGKASVAAVNAAHADVAAFTAGLAARVSTRTTCVAEADTRYIANEADSANRLAAVTHPAIDG